MKRPVLTIAAFVVSCALPLDAAFGQATRQRAIQGVDVSRLANGILALMSYTVVPDVTTSSLSFNNTQTENPGLFMTQLGGGFTWSKETLRDPVAHGHLDVEWAVLKQFRSQLLLEFAGQKSGALPQLLKARR